MLIKLLPCACALALIIESTAHAQNQTPPPPSAPTSTPKPLVPTLPSAQPPASPGTAPGAVPVPSNKAVPSQPSMTAQPFRSLVETFVEDLFPHSKVDVSEEQPGPEFYNSVLKAIADRHLLLADKDLRKAWLDKWTSKYKGTKQLDTPSGVDEVLPLALADVREMFAAQLKDKLAKAPTPAVAGAPSLPATNLSAHARNADDPKLLELLLLQLQWFDKYIAPPKPDANAKVDPNKKPVERTPIGLALTLKDALELRKQNESVTPQEFVQKILVASAKHPALIGEVLVGSPAEAAGIKAGELLTAIDGKPTEGKLLIDISGLVSEGKEGSTVELTLTSQDPASPTDPSKTVTRKVLVTRKHFQQKVVRFKDLGQSIAYISASEFNNTLEAEYEEAIKKLVDGNFQMLVIDMRDNGGGLVNAAKSLIEFTMASGYVVTEQHREGDKLERHALYLSREAKLTTNPAIVQGKIEAHVEQRKLLLPESVIIVVLTNNGTASSAELFTRALKANGRAETLGEPTFGKGIEQSVMTMAGRELRVTSAYFEPGDEWTNALPIEPTTLVKADPEKGDVQLEAAKKRLLELKARGEAERQKLKEALERQKETWSKAKH